MKANSLSILKRFLFFVLLISYIISNCQSIDELLEPKCDGSKIEYSILGNLSEYLKYENNIDGRELYRSTSQFQNKPVGIVKGTYLGDSTYKIVQEVETYDDLVYLLIYKIVDVGIVYDEAANNIHKFTNEVSKFSETLLNVSVGFGLQKGNQTLSKQLNEFMKNNPDLFTNLKREWDVIKLDTQYLNRTLDSTAATLNVIAKKRSQPYSYELADGSLVGCEIDYIYRFARENGYQINIIKADKYEEQVEALKNGTADIALGFFVIENNSDINFTNILYNGTVNYVVRYENLPESAEWANLYGSVDEFDGAKLGYLNGSFYTDITKTKFPKSELIEETNILDLLNSLLMGEINGFIFDEPFIEIYKIVFPYRVNYYVLEDQQPSENAFAFQNNTEGEALMKEFNDFIKTINLTSLYNKWNVANTFNLIIDTNLNESGKVINAGFEVDLRPICYYESNLLKGFEADVLYQFAKARGYNINFKAITAEERTSLIQDGTFNITGGIFTITDERKKLMSFSDPLYENNVVLAVRLDSKKYEMPLVAVNKNFSFNRTTMFDVHDVYYDVKFSDGQIKQSNCTLPSFYNDTILLNCTISDISGVDVSNGFNFSASNDSFYILYSNLRLDNFLQGNTKLPGHHIITESNKNNIVCYTSSGTSVTTSVATNATNASLYRNHGSSGGISTGAIIGITIPCVLLALGGLGAAFAFKSSASAATFYGSQESIQNLPIQYPNPNDYYIKHNIQNSNVIMNNVPNNNIIIPENNINIANKDVINVAQ